MGDDTGETTGMKRRRLTGDLCPLPAATEASFSRHKMAAAAKTPAPKMSVFPTAASCEMN